jgi:hypothetical protein
MSFRRQHRSNQQGYILLLLLLFFAILSIGFLEATKYDLQYTIQQIKRDREEELVHRGVQYSRAVRKFYKKFGRYPTRIEELENTNNYRSLRKRYKDPITGKDFKLLRLTDVQMFGSGPAGAGLTPAAALNQQQGAAGALSSGPMATTSSFGPGPIGGPQNPAGTQNPDSANQNDASTVDQGTAAAATTPSGVMPQTQSLPQQLGASGQPQVFGGSGIVGVASLSKDKTIREFNKKNHYNQWQFIYDPSTDRGGLLMAPNQPALQGQTNQPPNGQGGINGMNPAGPAGGFQNMPMAPQPPQNPPQNQQ